MNKYQVILCGGDSKQIDADRFTMNGVSALFYTGDDLVASFTQVFAVERLLCPSLSVVDTMGNTVAPPQTTDPINPTS